MKNYNNEAFGSLTLKQKKLYEIKSILKNDNIDLDNLFKNSLNKLDSLSVIEAERKMALENLRNLTSQLRERSLNLKNNQNNEYFSD
jgi:hypothetical protein